MDEEKTCKEFEKFTVCVPIEEDLGKKRILVIFSNDEEKWFEKTGFHEAFEKKRDT